MANTYLVEIGINDSLQDVVRKSNMNFRRLSFDARADSKTGIRIEADRATAALDGAVGEIEDSLDAARSELEDSIKDAEDRIDEKTDAATRRIEGELESIKDSLASINPAPIVGTWMFCDADPNVLYPGTTWERVAQGTFLMSSGANYTSGGSYGSNVHTLSANEMPWHNHAESMLDLQWTQDNPNGSGPGNVSMKVVTPGSGNAGAGSFRNVAYTGYAGASWAHNNIPQSIAVPLWHRTA